MILLIIFLSLLLVSFSFLPQIIAIKALKINTVQPTPLNQTILDILNFRYKLFAYLTFHRPKYTGTITDIHVHPLKSCSYLSVQSWEIDEIGLKHDRQYMIAFWSDSTSQYEAITLRNCPRLSLVKITYNLEENWFKFTYPLKNSNETSSFTLPCNVTEEYIEKNIVKDEFGQTTNLWGIKFPSINIGKALPQDFLESMNISEKPGITLLYTIQGKLVKTYNPPDLKKMRTSQFHDYFPIHILPQDFVDGLNEELAKTGTSRRVDPIQFRPNIVLNSVPKSINPDIWYRLKIKTQDDNSIHDWTTASRTPRCSIANVVLEKGEFDKTNIVTKVLRKYRKIDMGDPGGVYFGQYAIQHDSGYKISIGDELFVTENRINIYKGIH